MNTVQPIRDLKQIDHMKKSLMLIHPKYAMMFSIGINCGLRVSDILNLRVADVRGKDHFDVNVNVRSHMAVKEKKTKKTKRLFFNDKLQKEIARYIKQSGLTDDDYLIPSTKPDKDGNFKISRVQAYRVLNEAAEQCGLSEVGTHTMRKTFGYFFYKRTHDIALLMDLFNHSSPKITLRYIGIGDDMKDEALSHFYL